MKKILTLFVIILVFASCDESETTYNELSYPTDAFIAFNTFTGSINEDAADPISISVSYANSSSAATEDITIDFIVSSANGVENTDYSVVDGKSSFSFSPANGVYTDAVQIIPINNLVLGTDDVVLTITLGTSSFTTGYPGPDGIGKTFDLTILDDDCAKNEDLRFLQGSWTGNDNCDGYIGVPFNTVLPCLADGSGLLISDVGYNWLEDPTYWGEIVIEEFPVYMTVDLVAGTVEIADQAYVKTSFGATLAVYNIVGTGTITTGSNPVITLLYDMTNTDQGYGSMALDYAGSSCSGFFEATFTLN